MLDAGRPLNDYDGIIPGTQDSNTPNAGNLTSSPPPSDNQGLATQNAARPVLNRESSSFDSLQTFPPTPTDGVPPPFLLASTTFANPNSNFMAAVGSPTFPPPPPPPIYSRPVLVSDRDRVDVLPPNIDELLMVPHQIPSRVSPFLYIPTFPNLQFLSLLGSVR